MVSRSYATGRTYTFIARATLQLHSCGGTWISGPTDLLSINRDSGWLGSDFFHPLSRQLHADPIEFGTGSGHHVSVSAFAQSVSATTYRSEYGGTGTGQWNLYTDVLLNSTRIARWNSGPWDPAPVSQPPEEITVQVSISVPCAEWVDETDAAILAGHTASAGVRPADPYDPRLSVYWVPTGPAQITVSGDASGTGTGTALSVLQTPAHFALAVLAGSTEAIPAGAFLLSTLPQTAGLGALPYPGPYAACSGLALDGTVDTWSVQKLATDGSGFTRIESRLVGQDCGQNASDTHSIWDLAGTPRLEVGIDGVVRDWRETLTNVPIRFDGGGTYLFSRSIAIDDQPRPVVAPPAGYSPTDTGGALLRYDEGWGALTLDRAASLLAEPFSVVGGANGWAGTDCSSGPTVFGDEIAATGSGSGTPTLAKTLKSDFADVAADPGAWWTAHGSGLSSGIQSWWTATGQPGGSPHIGDWWKIGKKLLSGSDVWNWSSYRYLDLSGHADTACSITLTVSYTERYFEETSPYVVITHDTAKSVAYTVPLGTARASQRIDLAALAGQDGLRYVTVLQIGFPTGRTVHLHALTLVENARPVIDVHLPIADTAFLTATADGKHALFLSTRAGGPPNSLWGWPCLRRSGYTLDGTPDSRFQSLTLSELATEIGLQEGWSCSYDTDTTADHNNPGYATQLREYFAEPCPAQLSAQRGFGAATVYPHWQRSGAPSFPLEVNLGNAALVLAFDPTTHLPVRIDLEADDFGGVRRDGALSDATGAGQLDLTTEEDYTIWAGKGTASQSSAGVTTENRTMAFPRLTAAEQTGTGAPVLDIDRLGNRWITYVQDNAVKLGRQMGALTDWEAYDVGAVGSDAWLHVLEITPELRVLVAFTWDGSTVYLATSRENGLGRWQLAIIGTGQNPFIRVDKATHLAYFTYWRSDTGGTVFLKRSPDYGATFLEAEIAVKTGMTQATYTFDWALDDPHTMIMVYSDAGTLKTLTSTDNGLTWS